MSVFESALAVSVRETVLISTSTDNQLFSGQFIVVQGGVMQYTAENDEQLESVLQCNVQHSKLETFKQDCPASTSVWIFSFFHVLCLFPLS